jgi:hypothetical protein
MEQRKQQYTAMEQMMEQLTVSPFPHDHSALLQQQLWLPNMIQNLMQQQPPHQLFGTTLKGLSQHPGDSQHPDAAAAMNSLQSQMDRIKQGIRDLQLQVADTVSGLQVSTDNLQESVDGVQESTTHHHNHTMAEIADIHHDDGVLPATLHQVEAGLHHHANQLHQEAQQHTYDNFIIVAANVQSLSDNVADNTHAIHNVANNVDGLQQQINNQNNDDNNTEEA